MPLFIRRTLALAALCALAILWPASVADGSTVLYRTDAELVALADRVVHARVAGIRSETAPNGLVYTVATLAVLEDFTGGTEASLEVRELGGVHNGRFLYIGGAVRFEVGAEVVVCLERGPRGLRSLAMNFSKFDVLPARGGVRGLQRSTVGTEIVGGPARPAAAPTLSGFRTLTERVKRTAPRKFAATAPLQSGATASEPYSLLTFENGLGVRWVQADSGTPVRWYRNATATAPVPGDASAEIQAALWAWTNPASASIILQYAGNTNQTRPKGPWSGIGEGNGVITFEDPEDEIARGVLALGGGSGYVGGGGTVNGAEFNRFSHGHVVFQNAADLPASFRQSTNFARVLEHEIGHAIGLGHTRTDGSVSTPTRNIMYPSCCHSDTPLVPNLGPDDLATLNYVYPVETVACSFSLDATSSSYSAGGGSGSVFLSATDSSCPWTAASGSSWMSVSPASGTGSSAVSFAVHANGNTAARTGTLTVAGLTFTVNQAGAIVTRRQTVIDFSGDGIPDLGVFRPADGRWLVQGRPSTQWGRAGDVPVPGDYFGDRTMDLAVFRPSNGTWYIAGGPTIAWGAAGDIPVPADYNADGVTDIAVFRPASGQWLIRNVGTITWGAPGDLPVPGDYDGNGTADVAVWRPASGVWHVRNGTSIPFGLAGDIPVPVDYDGNGTTDYAVWRPSTGTWYVKDQAVRTFGVLGDLPIAVDRTGDGRAELGVFRPASGAFHLLNASNGSVESVALGAAGDIPLGRAPAGRATGGDFDGDRRADLTIYRPSTGNWVSLRSLSNGADYNVITWGLSTDVAVARDYDGDGKTDPAVYRPGNGTWYLRRSSTGFSDYIAQFWGLDGDVPVPADYDGDRRADVAVFRPSTGQWVVLLSTTGNTSYARHDFGLTGDIPVPADYDGDGRADIAVFRPSTGRWYVLDRFLGSYTAFDWGLPGDVPVAADYDGDGRAEIAVFRPSAGRWFIRWGNGTYTPYDWGLNGDMAVPADYDGDGLADVAVYRRSTGRWYILNRLQGTFTATDWGLPGDVPATRAPGQ